FTHTFSTLSPTNFAVQSDSLACINTTNIYPGSTRAVSLWNCTDQFTEEGLPSGGTWNVSFSGKSYRASTGTPIKISSALVTNTYAVAGFKTANAQSDNLDCHDNGIFQMFQGSNSTVNPWYCITSFSESGIDLDASGPGISGNLGWTVYFNNNNIFSSLFQGSGSVNQTGIVTVSPEPMYSDVNGLNCHSADSFQVTPGSSAPQFNSWTCITSFSGFPGQFTFGYNIPPQSFESTIYPTNTKVVNAYSLSTTSSTLTVPSTNSVVGPSVYMTGSVAPHSNATGLSYYTQWQSNDASSGSYTFTAGGSTAIFAISVGIPYFDEGITIGLPSGCSALSYQTNAIEEGAGLGHEVVFTQVNECNTTAGDSYTFTASNSGGYPEATVADFTSYPFSSNFYHFAYNPTNANHPSDSSYSSCAFEYGNFSFTPYTSGSIPGMLIGAITTGGLTNYEQSKCTGAIFNSTSSPTVLTSYPLYYDMSNFVAFLSAQTNYENSVNASVIIQDYTPSNIWSHVEDIYWIPITGDYYAWGTAASMVSALAMPENLTTSSVFNISAGGTVNVAYTPWGYSAFSYS
ncbi:MAG: hypothetical protein M1441_01080, partial [Candidatus Parvarchaeota archaeon]|nr:hypothetical protein [Candidatus Parvarchaeota archaeon]